MAGKRAIGPVTATPLDVAELGPARFDDLVRQLLYGFRTWKSLELDGGVEVVGDGIESTMLERPWRILTHHGRTVTPKTIRQIVKDAVPHPARAPHGFILATSASSSKASVEAFHDEAGKARIREAHLWSPSKIEELVLRPENDALLFAYFGASLRLRRHDRVATIRSEVAMTRTIIAIFGHESPSKDIGHHDVLVRSLTDETFPAPPFGTGPRRTWHFARTFSLAHDRVALELEDWLGIRRGDGTWDIDEATGELREEPNAAFRDDPGWHKRSRERAALERAIPKAERVRVIGVGWVPLSRIVEIDPIGTPGQGVPHVFCDFTSDRGPYASFSRIAYSDGGWPTYLDDVKRDRSLFQRLRERRT